VHLVNVTSLEKKFDGHSVVSIPAYTLDAGKGYVFYGYNGCGKTTLLKLLAGLEKPSSGSVTRTIDEKDRVMCFQHPYMFSGTVAQNCAYGAKLQKRTVDEQQLLKMASRYGIDTILNKRASVLSSGQKQTVALIRALLIEPKLLLLDEPSANLDKHRLDALGEDLALLKKRGGAFVITMHSNQRIVFPVDHCCQLENGNLIQDAGHGRKASGARAEAGEELTDEEAAALTNITPFIKEHALTCSDAFNVCEQLSISRGTLAKLLAKQNIKLKNCQWGCFK